MTPEEMEKVIIIHNAIHNPYAHDVVLDGKIYSINHYYNGCRYVDYDGVRFMEQNPAKNSRYATRARMGDAITWGMKQPNWICIINGEIRDEANR